MLKLRKWKWKKVKAQKVKVKSPSCVWLFATPWTAVHQAPPSTDFPGKSTGVGCHFLLQGIFPIQGSNPGLPHCRQPLLPSEPPGKHLPTVQETWVQFLGQEDLLEKGMATHSSILAPRPPQKRAQSSEGPSKFSTELFLLWTVYLSKKTHISSDLPHYSVNKIFNLLNITANISNSCQQSKLFYAMKNAKSTT